LSYNPFVPGYPNHREVFTEEYYANSAAHQVRLNEEKQIRAIRDRAAREGNTQLVTRCYDALAGREEACETLREMFGPLGDQS
jgi:hypothetical protein